MILSRVVDLYFFWFRIECHQDTGTWCGAQNLHAISLVSHVIALCIRSRSAVMYPLSNACPEIFIYCQMSVLDVEVYSMPKACHPFFFDSIIDYCIQQSVS